MPGAPLADADLGGGAGVLEQLVVAVPRKRLRGIAMRLSWGLADQGASSLTNFAMTIYAAHALTSVEFGAFSLAYVTYAFALTASRGLATDPLVVRFSHSERPAWARAVAGSSATAGTAGLVSGAAILAVVMLLSSPARDAFLALGLVLPGLLLQDSWRYAFFAVGCSNLAFLNDSIWALAMVPGLLYLRHSGHVSAFSFILVWGIAGAIAACAGPLQSRVLPRPTRVWGWLLQHRDLGLRYLAENSANSGASQLRSYGLALMVNVMAVGYVQAATTLAGPFLVVFMGLSLVTVPEAVRVLHRSPRHLPLFCLLFGAGLAVGALAWGGVLLIALPRGLGSWLLPHSWHEVYGLILPLTISVMGACFIQGATAGLHALGLAKRSLRAMLFSSAVYLGCGLGGAAWDGAVGTMIGAGVATWTGAGLWWWQLRAGLRDAGILAAGRHRRALDIQSTSPEDTIVQSGGPERRGVQDRVPASADEALSALVALSLCAMASSPWRPPVRADVASLPNNRQAAAGRDSERDR